MKLDGGAMRRVLKQLISSACLVLGLTGYASAQDYPNRSLRLIVAFPAGGGSDIVGRLLALKLGERLGQQIVVENRAGAGGSIGTEAGVRAASDGYTLLLGGTSEIAVNPHIYKAHLRHDQRSDPGCAGGFNADGRCGNALTARQQRH